MAGLPPPPPPIPPPPPVHGPYPGYPPGYPPPYGGYPPPPPVRVYVAEQPHVREHAHAAGWLEGCCTALCCCWLCQLIERLFTAPAA